MGLGKTFDLARVGSVAWGVLGSLGLVTPHGWLASAIYIAASYAKSKLTRRGALEHQVAGTTAWRWV